METSEKWLPVVGYEGLYEVSNNGYVRALYREGIYKARWGMAKMNFPAKILKLSKNTNGYNYVSLSKNSNHRKYLIHRLVLIAFVGESDLQCNHKDGNKENNNLYNLEFCTNQENSLHSTRVLKQKIGELNGKAKLKYDDIKNIRSDNRILREIAKDYGVTLQAIHHIKIGKTWSHVKD